MHVLESARCGRGLKFASLADLPRMEQLIKAHIKRLDHQPKTHPNVESHIAICYRDNYDEVLATARNFQTKKPLLLCDCNGMVGWGLSAPGR
jgi:hypothetical protein